MIEDVRSKPQGIKGKMRYAIKLNQSEGKEDIPRIARDFIRALVAEGHQVTRMFFYHDGVRQGFSAAATEWVGLAERGQFELILCSQALDHRGLAAEVQLPFLIGGLGLWVDACLKADRVLSFGVPSDEV